MVIERFFGGPGSRLSSRPWPITARRSRSLVTRLSPARADRLLEPVLFQEPLRALWGHAPGGAPRATRAPTRFEPRSRAAPPWSGRRRCDWLPQPGLSRISRAPSAHGAD